MHVKPVLHGADGDMGRLVFPVEMQQKATLLRPCSAASVRQDS